MEYKSQVGQDKWVLNFFNGKPGFFLDIGAYDGLEYSNSYCLEYNGWNGICIEPNPVSYKKLNRNRNCITINKAVGYKKEILKLNDIGMSSNISDTATIDIFCDTLENILNEYNAPLIIDYISLDVEGFEINALNGFPFNKREFILMTVEHNLYLGSSENKNGIYNILIANGYIRINENVEHNGYAFEDWYINSKYIL